MLEIKDLHVYYGAIHAIKGISLKVDQGSIVTLIGANGAGKSTILKTISGILRSGEGEISYGGRSIKEASCRQIVEQGLIHVPEGRRVFADMSVKENLEMGGFLQKDKAWLKETEARVFEKFPRLEERVSQLAGTLSGGEQQMLAIGRGMMSNPKMLLLDEPSMGLAPLLVREIFAIIKELNQAGITVLLVEQNANMALSIADYAYVLETGKITLEGPAAELAASAEVKKAYLGG
ncbi:MAG: ABC transporter ATP-binding protein [Clostridiales bacterium]